MASCAESSAPSTSLRISSPICLASSHETSATLNAKTISATRNGARSIAGRNVPAARPGRNGAGSALLDGSPDEGAVFGPRAVVVLDVAVPEQLGQREPGVRAPLADAAVG